MTPRRIPNRKSDLVWLDRYAAQNEDFVPVVPRIAVLGAPEVRQAHTGNRPTGSAGIARGGAPWLVACLVTGLIATAAPAVAQTDSRALVTFTRDIAPILQRSCETCHRPGGGAPMPLVTYDDVRPWARAIKLRTSLREMPPWFIEKNVGIQRFKNDPSLSDEEIARIGRWVDSGAPRGNPADMPPARQWAGAAHWSIGTPDLIVSSPVMTVQPVAPDWHGVVGPFPTGLTEDRYVKAIEVKEVRLSGEKVEASKAVTQGADLNYTIVHHAVISDTLEDSPRRDGAQDSLIIHELGQNAMHYPEAVGRLLKTGSKLIMPDVHLHSIGKETSARLDIGFTFHPAGHTPKYTQAPMVLIGNPRDELDIPAGRDDVRLDAYYTMPKPGMLLTFEPHMHAAGSRMCLEVFHGGATGPREMINCAGYNHNWVKVYAYEDDAAPLLAQGTLVHIMGWFNNTSTNRRVIDPRNWRGYGRRSIDDMFILLPRIVFLTDEEYTREVTARETKARRESTTARAK